MENIHDIFFENLPTSLKEGQKAFITIQSFHYLKNLSLLKSSLHPNSLLITNGIKMKTIQFYFIFYKYTNTHTTLKIRRRTQFHKLMHSRNLRNVQGSHPKEKQFEKPIAKTIQFRLPTKLFRVKKTVKLQNMPSKYNIEHKRIIFQTSKLQGLPKLHLQQANSSTTRWA